MVTAKAGDILWLYLGDAAGHEQSGRCPALVVSNSLFNEMSSVVLVCPISGGGRPFPLNVPLDDRTKTQGMVLCAQVRAFDLAARRHQVKERVPAEILAAVHGIIGAALSAEPEAAGDK